MSVLMDIAKDVNGADDPVMGQMVVDAYDSPRFQTDRNRASAVDDYRNKWELVCFKQAK
ncbi:hypothetical protein GCM10011321_14600 [Youhaiella tibetensis]|nr:hypothetical protein GCM10011321_14600 [Youhaiella tibetensis]